MEFSGTFLPTAASSGLLACFTWYTMVATMFFLIASTVFSWLTRTHVAPEHNTSRVLTACISIVAAVSYFLIQDYFRTFLQAAEGVPSYTENYAAFLAIGQLRYMDWTITTPLLLIKMFMMVHATDLRGSRLLYWAIVADIFMIATGYIGDQQLAIDGGILVGPRLIWGAISTIGYLFIVYALYRVWQQYAPLALPIERRAFRLMAGTVVTLWGVYPIGYILIAVTSINADYLQIAYSVADVVNKVGVGIIVYLAGSSILEERINVKSPEYAMSVG